jgi:hypothetical protein
LKGQILSSKYPGARDVPPGEDVGELDFERMCRVEQSAHFELLRRGLEGLALRVPIPLVDLIYVC